MRSLLIFLLLLLLIFQSLNAQTLGLLAGKSLIPGNYIALKYQHPLDFPFCIQITAFNESSQKSNLRYNSYGLDLGLAIKNMGDQFSYGIAIGPSVQYEAEPWLYANWPTGKHINLGIQGELFVESEISQSFSLTLFAQQKYFLNASLGNFRFNYGLGLQFRFQ